MALLVFSLLLALVPAAVRAQPTCAAGSTGTIPTVCPLSGATSAQVLLNSNSAYTANNLPTAAACASVCRNFAVYQYTPATTAGAVLGSVCVCSNVCSFQAVPAGVTIYVGSSTVCAASDLTDYNSITPSCPTACYANTNFGWAMPFNDPTFEEDGQPYQIGFFRPQAFLGAPAGFVWTGPVCAQRCAAEGATYYQFVESNQPAGVGLTALGYLQGDCACFRACVVGAFVDLNAPYAATTTTPQAGPIVVSGGSVCACNSPQASCLADPTAIQMPTPTCVNKGRCDVNGIQATEFECNLCNTNNQFAAYNALLSNAQLFGYGPISGVLQTSGITPNGELPGLIAPLSCRRFSYKTTLSQYPFGPVVLNPFPTVSVATATLPAITTALLQPCTISYSDRYPTLIASVSCSIRNTGTSPIRNLVLTCTNWDPLTYGGINPDCSITKTIRPGEVCGFSFTLPWDNGAVSLTLSQISTTA